MAIFKVPMSAVSISTAQDLWHIKAGATYPVVIHEIVLSQKTLVAVEGKDLKLMRHTVAVTQGSGGSTPTSQNVAPGGGSSGCTIHMNDTTQASSGTLTTLHADVWQLLNGFFWMPAPEDRIFIAPSTGFIVSLAAAPSAPMIASGTVTYEELGL
ncbi:MAG: hypothetical protein U1E60_00335 [Reyranellaceae bacterium]